MAVKPSADIKGWQSERKIKISKVMASRLWHKGVSITLAWLGCVHFGCWSEGWTSCHSVNSGRQRGVFAGNAGEYIANYSARAWLGVFIKTGRDQEWMQKEGGGVLQHSGKFLSIDSCELAGFETLFNQLFENVVDFF